MFDEDWRRLAIKMATGSGKTKVLSLILAWCYFHKLYEPDSELARNFLIITPNIIVLDRLRTDFDGLRIFFGDPVVPDNGYEGQNWKDDFQLTLHIQDNVNITRKIGNIFLTNIHRVYASNDVEPSFEDDDLADYFLGRRPTGETTDSRVDLGDIVREIDELVVLNDEAHHIHDKRLAWFRSIEDIHNRLKQKDHFLSLQVDVTATPKHTNGAIFVQTVSDYPLVEAITQNVVKHPVLPDSASRKKLIKRQSAIFTEKYADYLNLGVEEWRKAYAEHEKVGKKAILFAMTDDTKNCDEVAEYLEDNFPELKDSVLVIHTKNNGEISEAGSKKAKEEMEKLRKQANEIDGLESPYKAIVSVMMLKEGWDVRNVTTIVGLRAYSAKSNILPEQTLGRGIRCMYPGSGSKEYVSVIGTDAFVEFVESIQSEGVELEHRAMGEGTKPKTPLIVEVDNENTKKDIDKLDIRLPVLTPRIYRNYKDIENLNPATFGNAKVEYKQFSEEEKREIVFKDITTGEATHTTTLDSIAVTDYRNAIGYFTQRIMKDLNLFSGYDILYGKVKEFTAIPVMTINTYKRRFDISFLRKHFIILRASTRHIIRKINYERRYYSRGLGLKQNKRPGIAEEFIQHFLFDEEIRLDDLNTLRNLSELEATRIVIETFKKKINELTVQDKGDAKIKDNIKLSQTRPFVVKEQDFIIPKKSVFNKIIGDSQLKLDFAQFLDECDDIFSYVKNYFAVNFRIDYVNAEGKISNYYPDFIVKKSENEIYIIETKGLKDLDVLLKMKRLKQWCEDVNQAQKEQVFDYVFVDGENIYTYAPSSFEQLVNTFKEYKDE